MEPAYKSEQVLSMIKATTGVDLYHCIRNNLCVPPPYGCGEALSASEFRDGNSIREYSISGMCQHCQDKVFLESDDDEYHRD